MFVRKIKSNKGIIEVGKYGVDRIDVHDDGIVSNSKNHHKNLY